MARPAPFWCLSLFAVSAHVKPAVHALHDASSKPTIGIHTSLVSSETSGQAFKPWGSFDAFSFTPICLQDFLTFQYGLDAAVSKLTHCTQWYTSLQAGLQSPVKLVYRAQARCNQQCRRVACVPHIQLVTHRLLNSAGRLYRLMRSGLVSYVFVGFSFTLTNRRHCAITAMQFV